MKIYQVGGSVRDELLGLPIADRDYVVVGSSPKEMMALGYKPVGKDFPVFLHPITHEEYALARTERKVGKGYSGFTFFTDPSVTLEEDLKRRDFTVNAIAKDNRGTLIDPFGGVEDLKKGIFRHVSQAFVEDPLRILRLGRFLARFPQFEVAEETLKLAEKMVSSGELSHLTLERRWQEWKRGLNASFPERMVRFLGEINALPDAMGWIEKETRFDLPRLIKSLELTKALGGTLAVKWLSLLFVEDIHHPIRSTQLPLPSDIKNLQQLFSETYHQTVKVFELNEEDLHKLIRRLDMVRRPERFQEWLLLMKIYQAYRGEKATINWPMAFLKRVAQKMRDIREMNYHGLSPHEIVQQRKQREISVFREVKDKLLNEMVSRETTGGPH